MPQSGHYTCPEKFHPTFQEADTSTLLSTKMGQSFSGELYVNSLNLPSRWRRKQVDDYDQHLGLT